MVNLKATFAQFILSIATFCLIASWNPAGGSAQETGSHAEIFASRKARAIETWNRAFPDQEATTLETSELVLLGNVPHDRLTAIKDDFVKAIAAVRTPPLFAATSPLRSAKPDEPLIRGGLAIFVLKTRYDYSEFGKMIENRELPREWTSHWRANAENAYAVVVDSNTSEVLTPAMASQLFLGAYWGSQPGVPFWFAEGMARNFIPAKFRKDYRRMGRWPFESLEASKRIPDSKALIDGNVDEETQGLVGMRVIAAMMSNNNFRQFQSLLKQIRKGTNFSEAMTDSFGEPEAIIKYWLGK